MLAFLQFYPTYISPITRNLIPFAGLAILWLALRRAGMTGQMRTTGIVATVVVLVWWALADFVARTGFYAAHWDVMRPLCWAVAIAFVIPLVRSASIAAALDAIPPWWLVALQVYRAGALFVWLAAWASGRAGPVALIAGIGDGLVGVLALVPAVWLARGARGGRIAAIIWNVFGLLDFLNAFIIGSFLPSTLPYPAVMIPVFLAPLSADIHALSIRQLIRAVRRERRPELAPVTA